MGSKASLLVYLALIVSPSLSQITPNVPVCQNSELRVLNGEGGTPCAVLSTVLTTLQLVANIPSLPPGEAYGLPSDGAFPLGSDQMCTTEMYNLVQGCAACQQASNAVAEQLQYPPLTEWNRRCTEQNLRTGPNSDLDQFIVKHTIPTWAQAAPSVGDTFNVRHLLATLPSVPLPGATLSFLPSTNPVSAESGTVSPVAAPSSVALASGSSPPLGPIIGGVVGGVVFLLLIGGLIFWLCRRKRSRSHLAPSAEFMNARHIPLAQDDDDDREMSAPMRQRHSMASDAPPAFTPGQFKDPIFEKGVAISTGAMPMSSVGHSAATSYSPVTPSSAQQGPMRQSSGDQYHQGPMQQSSGDQYQPGPMRQSSGDQYQSSADAYQTSASHQYHSSIDQYHSSIDQYHSSIDQYRSDVLPHSPHSPEMAQGYRD